MQSRINRQVHRHLELTHCHLTCQEVVHGRRQNGHGDVGFESVFAEPRADEDVAGGHLPFSTKRRLRGFQTTTSDLTSTASVRLPVRLLKSHVCGEDGCRMSGPGRVIPCGYQVSDADQPTRMLLLLLLLLLLRDGVKRQIQRRVVGRDTGHLHSPNHSKVVHP